MCCHCCLYLCFSFAGSLLPFWLFTYPSPPIGQEMVSIPFLHCEDFVTGVEVDQWLGCHGYLLSITSLANHLICCTAPTCSLWWSIGKLISFYLFVGIFFLLLLFLVFFFLMYVPQLSKHDFFFTKCCRVFFGKTQVLLLKSWHWLFSSVESYKIIWSTAFVGGIPQNYEKLCGDLYNLKHKQLKAFVIIIITKLWTSPMDINCYHAHGIQIISITRC